MEWIYTANDPLVETLLGSVLIFCAVIILTRLIGLRSFAKFTAYDFAFTVAIGSIISSTLTSSTTIAHGSVAIAGLLLLTYIFSTLQKKIPALSAAISNKPLLLMKGEEILHKNLQHARIEESQLMAKLREANVFEFSQILAVVLESTGDISVIHSNDEDTVFDSIAFELLEDVREEP